MLSKQDNVGESPVLSVENLGKVYTSGSTQFEAIKDVNFTLKRGELVCVVGPSGAGKTTMLRCIAGLSEPSRGKVVLEGEIVKGPPSNLAVVFQEYGRSLFPWMTVAANIELPLKEKGVPSSRRAQLVQNAIDAVSLSGFESSYPWQLSGGMQQRVAIARAVAFEPHILLMDEPFAAVDAQTRAELEDLILALWRELDITVLFITHDIDESVYLAERILVLSSAPTEILKEVQIELPSPRSQLETRSAQEFALYRKQVYELIQQAKAGVRPGEIRASK